MGQISLCTLLHALCHLSLDNWLKYLLFLKLKLFEKRMSVHTRKNEHIEIALEGKSQFSAKTTGFEQYEFLHFASSEVLAEEINLELSFLSKRISSPFLISSMTGGTEEALRINSVLAEAAEELKIPIGVGSQRAMLENPERSESFEIVREKAPSVPVLANIGAAEFVKMNSNAIEQIMKPLNADALFVHLNLPQEMIQREGKADFKGLLEAIEKYKRNFHQPLIIKEVGFGISKIAAETLLSAGADGIDVAGAGGTSWSKIEYIRSGKEAGGEFAEWGLPTAFCIRTVKELKNKFDFILIGSGGITDAFAYAKALALGADIVASARTVLLEAKKNGVEGVIRMLLKWNDVLKKIMALTNSPTLKEFNTEKLILKRELY
jgi:isopentenyl-diphosphate delta-isomerase